MGRSKKGKKRDKVSREEQSTLTGDVGLSVTENAEPPAAVSEWLGESSNAGMYTVSVLKTCV